MCGILLQHPVPAHIDERACFDAISLEKDVDGVTTAGFGRAAMGLDAFLQRHSACDCIPCSSAIISLLRAGKPW